MIRITFHIILVASSIMPLIRPSHQFSPVGSSIQLQEGGGIIFFDTGILLTCRFFSYSVL